MSNRVSVAGSVSVLLLLAAPSQLPAITTEGALGSVLIKANPVSAGLQLAQNVLVKQEPWSDQWGFILSPAIAAVVLTVLATLLSSRLELGDAR
jgi:hypothetical protein